MRATLFHMEEPPSNWLTRVPPPRRLRRLDDPGAVRLLATERALRLLRPFHGLEATVSQAAHENGLDVKRMYHLVSRWHRYGILEVVREIPRAGKPLKVYSTNCDWLIVPHTLTDAIDTDELTRQQVGPVAADLAVSFLRDHLPGPAAFHVIAGPEGRFGFPVGPDDVDAVRTRAGGIWAAFDDPPRGRVPGAFQIALGPLERQDAVEIEAMLRRVYREAERRIHRCRADGTGRPYGLFLAFARAADGDA
jgi:hypothetical protein